ncbi:MAG: GspE/PulE family protein, partial [Myxococcota bacterium]|nr:GspE/PulE family protein [Myxococcota bacterium]
MDDFAELADFNLDPASIRRLDREFCLHHQVVVLGAITNDSRAPVTLGMLHPERAQVRASVGRRLRRTVQAVRLNAYEVRKAIAYGFDGPLDGEAAGGVLLPLGASRVGHGASPTELLDDLLCRAIRQGASDIHIERYVDDVDVRLRVDGVLQQSFTHIDPSNVEAVVSRVKVLSGLDITERRVSQDGRFRVRLEEDPDETPARIDLRVSTAPGLAGEDVVMRVLRMTGRVLTLEELGLDAARRGTVEALLANPEGLILVTGPTGSGKTTTLYSMLDRIRSATKKVLTAENPIEVVLEKVNQKQVSAVAGMADLARAFLRQDPDVIMVGEIRDAATAETVIKGSSTGHLVLSTLHTPDAWGAVGRLEGLGIARSRIAEVSLGIVAQRLVRRLCQHCTRPTTASDRQRRLFGPLIEGVQVHVGQGCSACNGTGFKGRIGLYEVLVVDEHLQDEITGLAAGHDV